MVGVAHEKFEGERVLDDEVSEQTRPLTGASDTALTLSISLLELVGQGEFALLPLWPDNA
jgi:hypothetical protein